MLDERDVQEFKRDLQRAKNMTPREVKDIYLTPSKAAAYVDNPEKILFALCKALVEKNNEWVERDEILELMIEDLGSIHFSVNRRGRGLNVYLENDQGEPKKWNPVDWFSKHYTDIESSKSHLKKDIIGRWFNILERKKSRKWAYRIRPEVYPEIKNIFQEVVSEPSSSQSQTSELILTPKEPVRTFDSSIENTTRYTTDGMTLSRPKPSFRFFERDAEDKIVGDVLEKLGLQIFTDEHGRSGRQYDTYEVGRIDLLCKDRNGNFVVVELKKGEASDQVISQLQRYMGWVRQKLAGDNQDVKGLILAEKSDRYLEYAVKANPNIQLKYYRVLIELLD
jgi:hypothetical protein